MYGCTLHLPVGSEGWEEQPRDELTGGRRPRRETKERGEGEGPYTPRVGVESGERKRDIRSGFPRRDGRRGSG